MTEIISVVLFFQKPVKEFLEIKYLG